MHQKLIENICEEKVLYASTTVGFLLFERNLSLK